MAASESGGGAPVAHHFNNLKQQQATVRFGMWMFLVTEVMFFGGALCAYTAYRIWFPREFEAGSAALNVGIAAVNTFLLLTSSFTCSLAIRACYEGNRSKLKMWLMATIVLGTVFLGLKAREYQIDYHEGLLPTLKTEDVVITDMHGDTRVVQQSVFVGHLTEALHHQKYKFLQNGDGLLPVSGAYEFNHDAHRWVAINKDEVAKKQAEGYVVLDMHKVQLFFLFYYILTGLHVIHMIIGVGLLLWQYMLAMIGFFDFRERYIYVEVMSLYWHFVDMVWMFLVPLLYLAGPHSFGQAVAQFKMAIGLGH